jgi:hypothetical protein
MAIGLARFAVDRSCVQGLFSTAIMMMRSIFRWLEMVVGSCVVWDIVGVNEKFKK